MPAFRYARWSSTGKAARASSKVGGKGRASLGGPHARSPRRPARVHPAVRPRARLGARSGGRGVELVTSPFRFGDPPEPDGYTRSELFYPLSSKIFRRSRLASRSSSSSIRSGLARLRRRSADVAHVQWLAAPELDDRLLRQRAPLVFTAHDLLPRRTAAKRDLWRRLFGRFERIIVHSERGRDQLAELTDPARLRVISHPVYASNPERRDDGRTLLCLGIIRAYKGIGRRDRGRERQSTGHGCSLPAIPLEPVDGYRAAAGDTAEWRLGYLSDDEIDRALGETTVALFPYRPEIDQSGALMRALGAGVPAVVYDVGGLGEPVRTLRGGPGRPAG